MSQHAQGQAGRYLDDFLVGDSFLSPGVTITEAQIIDFALHFDPQAFHLDSVAAAQSIYGGLIASGFHVIALTFRLFIQTGVLAESSMGSPGVDEVRWLAPVRPGDTLRVSTEVVEVRPSNSRPDRGIARLRYSTLNQRDEMVASFVVNHLLKRRP